MSRRVLANVLLVVVITALGLFLVLSRPRPEQTEAPSLAHGIDSEQLSRIRIERAGLDEVSFERDGSAWRMTTPVAARAHPARINSILGLVHETVYARFPAEPGALKRFGLVDPRVRVYLDRHIFALGDTNPLDERRYVLYGDNVYLIGDSLYFQLTQNAGFFIDSRLLDADAHPVRIQYPDRLLTQAGGAWTSEPETGLGADAVQNAALTWESARAISVRTLQDQPGTGTVVVELQGGATVRFEILETGPAVILARRDLGVQYHLDAYTARQLLLVHEQQSDPGSDE